MRKRTLLVALTVLLLTTTSGAFGSPNVAGSGAFESSTGAWFVELNGSAEAFHAKAKASGLQVSERFKFNQLFKGVSVNADAETAQLLKKIDGVVSVQPVGVLTTGPIANVSEPELVHALSMTGADLAQQSGYTGKGVKVGVMDTGVDYHNPALGGCFGASCRVTTGHDFVGDRYNASASGGALVPHPDNDPDDCNGHGTHVAGIVGAKGTVNGQEITGVAPEVTFGAYRVFGCEGSTSEDIMIAAMEKALADGMDVLNLSIGDAFAWDTDITATAMNTAVDRGMHMVISAGNSGANGLYSLSSAGNAEKVIGVASIDNRKVELKTFTAKPDDRAFGYMQATAAPDAPTSGTAALTRLNPADATNTADGCAALPAGSLANKWVLIRRGTCTFHIKSMNAQNAGALGVVLYNNAAGLFAATVAGSPAITIPVVTISNVDGAILAGRIPTAVTDTVELTWTDETGTFDNPTSGQPSSFTAWGLAPSLGAKPDIAAPGGLIKSTWPMEAGGVSTISGTSMAAPHVSGAVALYLQARGDIAPMVLRELLQNSAVPSTLTGPFANAVHRQGAGTIQIDDAILATSSVTPGKLALGEGTTAQTKALTIRNNGSAAVTYAVAHQLAVGTSANTFAPGVIANNANVTFSSSQVTVPAGGTATVDVSIAPLVVNGTDRTIYSGYIRLTPQGGGQVLRVPYVGFTGDYQSIRALAPGACNFPGVFKLGGETVCVAATPTTPAVKLPGATRQLANATYNVAERTDRPVLLWHMAHQAQRLEIRAVNAANEEFLVAAQDLFERNPTNDLSATGFFQYTWDGKAVFANAKNGTANRRALPSGTYKLRVVVTKAGAETNNPAHVETWDSETLNIVTG